MISNHLSEIRKDNTGNNLLLLNFLVFDNIINKICKLYDLFSSQKTSSHVKKKNVEIIKKNLRSCSLKVVSEVVRFSLCKLRKL